MKMNHLGLLGLALVFLTGGVHGQGSDTISPRKYADPATGLLDEDRAARYLVARDKVPFDDVTTDDAWDAEKAKERVGDALSDLVSQTGRDGPWRWQDIDAVVVPTPSSGEEKPRWQQIAGVTEALDLSPNNDNLTAGPVLGPIRIRQNSAGLTQRVLSEAKGATLGYSNNRLEGGGDAWNSTGAIGYPIKWRREGGPGTGKSTTFEIGPAFDWSIAQVQGSAGNEVEEANLSLPFTLYRTPGRQYSALWIAQGKPYLQTDFSGGHRIYGVEGSLEFVGRPFGRNLFMGAFQNAGIGSLQYQLRLVPRVDYSETDRTGEHSTRIEGDDWFRLGGLVSLDFRTGADNPIDIGASYEFFSTVSGDGGYLSLTQAYLTWWLSANTGLTFLYRKGDTPVADQEIDLMTLGLEFKY